MSQPKLSRFAAASLTAGLVVLGLAATPAQAGPADPVHIPDDNLKKCINNELGRGVDSLVDVTETNAASLTHLWCTLAVDDLTGVEYLVNLDDTRFIGTYTDLSPLASHTLLEQLELSSTGIADLAALTGLPALWKLTVYSSSITNLDPLPTNLPALEELRIERSPLLTDVTALLDAPALRGADILGGAIVDISALVSGSFASPALTSIQIVDQVSMLDSVWLASPVANPVKDLDGAISPLTPAAGAGDVTHAADWSSLTAHNPTPADKDLTWSHSRTVGAINFGFTGTLTLHTVASVTIAPISDVAVTSGETVAVDVVVESAVAAPYTVEVTGLPAGLTFNTATNRISGTTSGHGTYPITVTAVSTEFPGYVATRTFIITVNAAPTTAPSTTPATTPTSPGPQASTSTPAAITTPTTRQTSTLATTGNNGEQTMTLVAGALLLLVFGAGIITRSRVTRRVRTE